MPDDENPYESPRADPTPAQRTARRLGTWFAVPLTLIAMGVTFCCACYPTAIVAYGMAYGVSYPSSRWAWLAYPLMFVPWVVGAVVAVWVGRMVWKWR